MKIGKIRAWVLLRYTDCVYLMSGAEDVAHAHGIQMATEDLLRNLDNDYKNKRELRGLHTKWANSKEIHKVGEKYKDFVIEWNEYEAAELIDGRYLYLTKDSKCVGGYYLL